MQAHIKTMWIEATSFTSKETIKFQWRLPRFAYLIYMVSAVWLVWNELGWSDAKYKLYIELLFIFGPYWNKTWKIIRFVGRNINFTFWLLLL